MCFNWYVVEVYYRMYSIQEGFFMKANIYYYMYMDIWIRSMTEMKRVALYVRTCVRTCAAAQVLSDIY